MIKKREIVLIIILMVLIAGVAYYFLYFRPTADRIVKTTNSIAMKSLDLDAAILRDELYESSAALHETLTDELAKYTETLPSWFDDADVLRRLQRIIYPHTQDINVIFPEGPKETKAEGEEEEEEKTTDIYTVTVKFMVPYTSLQTILQDIQLENTDNRVINYEVELMEEPETGNTYMQTTLEIDFLVSK